MAKEPRNHHYIPQCYLRGFGWRHKKQWYTNVVFGRAEDWHVTNIRNVGAERDFLRFEVLEHDANAIEKAMADMEGEIATSLRSIEETKIFRGDDRTMILNLIAMLAVRSPWKRQHWGNFQAQMAERIMDMVLGSKEIWEGQIRQMKEAGKSVNEAVTYQQMKDFHERKEYTIEVPRERHIETEMHVFNTVLQSLSRRDWSLYVTNEELGPFVSCDSPVCLDWIDPPKTKTPFNQSPSFDLKNSQVYFPISKKLALIGEFDAEDATYHASPHVVGMGNVNMIENAREQLYASSKNFKYYGPGPALFHDESFMERFADAKANMEKEYLEGA